MLLAGRSEGLAKKLRNKGDCMLLAGRSEGLAKKLRNKGVNACYWQTGQKDLQRG